jgi:hypothetical protein
MAYTIIRSDNSTVLTTIQDVLSTQQVRLWVFQDVITQVTAEISTLTLLECWKTLQMIPLLQTL